MARIQKDGVCHVCGRYGKLSFEHIPPRSMGNDHRIDRYRAADVIEKNGLNFNGGRGVRYARQLQQGNGFLALCSDCNSYLGANYVEDFAGLCKEIGSVLLRDADTAQSESIHIVGENLNMLAFFKQVISNFCTTCHAGSMADCRRFLLDKESNDFPSHYRLYMFAVPERETILTTGWTHALTKIQPLEGHTSAVVAFFPVGFCLVDTDRSNIVPDGLGWEITSMASYAWGSRPRFEMSLPFKTLEHMAATPYEPRDSNSPDEQQLG